MPGRLRTYTLMKNFIFNLRTFFEKHGFYVSSRLADMLGMKAKSVRIFFIYISFVHLRFWFWTLLNFSVLVEIERLGLYQAHIGI